MPPITVIKRNLEGLETFRYTGQVLERGQEYVLLEARFNRPDLPFHGIVLGKGDRFVEIFFSNRWYNIFEIHDRDDDTLKGWYCNIGFPAEIGAETVSYIDLALDLLVFPDGRQLVLDEDEFSDLSLSPQIREKGKASLAELQGVLVQMLARAGARPDQKPIVSLLWRSSSGGFADEFLFDSSGVCLQVIPGPPAAGTACDQAATYQEHHNHNDHDQGGV